VHRHTVQENDLSGGYGPGGMTSWGSGPSTYVATINTSFLKCFALANDNCHFRDDGCCGGGHLVINSVNSEYYSDPLGAYYNVFGFTNCLFFRSGAGLSNEHNDCGLTFQDCTFYGSGIGAAHWSGSTWPIKVVNCAFDNCNFSSISDTNYFYCDYNAFLTNQVWLPVLGLHDVTNLMTFNWQSSWFGNYYLPSDSSLINAGSTNADQLGLYHFTTQTNQVTETNSVVDIGYHYVATDAYGNPLDSNGDNIPDYLEDANGNGLVDSGELDWSSLYYDQGFKVFITRPKNGSQLP
jgi:hypothetical protein